MTTHVLKGWRVNVFGTDISPLVTNLALSYGHTIHDVTSFAHETHGNRPGLLTCGVAMDLLRDRDDRKYDYFEERLSLRSRQYAATGGRVNGTSQHIQTQFGPGSALSNAHGVTPPASSPQYSTNGDGTYDGRGGWGLYRPQIIDPDNWMVLYKPGETAAWMIHFSAEEQSGAGGAVDAPETRSVSFTGRQLLRLRHAGAYAPPVTDPSHVTWPPGVWLNVLMPQDAIAYVILAEGATQSFTRDLDLQLRTYHGAGAFVPMVDRLGGVVRDPLRFYGSGSLGTAPNPTQAIFFSAPGSGTEPQTPAYIPTPGASPAPFYLAIGGGGANAFFERPLTIRVFTATAADNPAL